MKTKTIAQIVITRRGDKFSVTTFNTKECLGGPELNETEARRFIAKKMKLLKQSPGLDA